jgi:hypothetical protein
MMTRPRPPSTVIDAIPLFAAREVSAHMRLTGERADLVKHIAKLPPHSHRAIILCARLRDMTTELLRLEAVLFARAG